MFVHNFESRSSHPSPSFCSICSAIETKQRTIQIQTNLYYKLYTLSTLVNTCMVNMPLIVNSDVVQCLTFFHTSCWCIVA